MIRTFTYAKWGGGQVTVDCEEVEFGPAHVIFRTGGEITLAEPVAQVNQLREVTNA